MARLATRFNVNTNNWTIAGDVNVFEWRGDGGNPGGHLFWEDAASGAVAYWAAPGRFLGNQGAFRGGTLEFDWYSQGSGPGFDAPDIVLNGGGLTLFADVDAPATAWDHVSISLSRQGGWVVGTPDGPRATTAQIATVLRDLADVRIRAEHIDGAETGGLDNVVFTSKPVKAFSMDAFGGADAMASPGHAVMHPDVHALAIA